MSASHPTPLRTFHSSKSFFERCGALTLYRSRIIWQLGYFGLRTHSRGTQSKNGGSNGVSDYRARRCRGADSVPQSGVKWQPLQAAQAPTARPAPAVAAQTQAAPAIAPQTSLVARFLPAGTLVSLTPLEELSSKHIKEGERYQFIVVNDVVDNGGVVIPRGSNAIGVITKQTGRGIVGKSGKFDVTFESVTANGATFALSGIHRQEGKGNTVGALLGSMWITGHSAVMLPGEVVTAFTKERTAY